MNFLLYLQPLPDHAIRCPDCCSPEVRLASTGFACENCSAAGPHSQLLIRLGDLRYDRRDRA